METRAMLDSLPTPEQIDRANAAVTENLDADGVPKYESAWGYACALTAIMQTDAARPTADLGEDGELVAWLLDCVATAEDACKADGDNEVYAARHAKLRAIADRLILYREARDRFCEIIARAERDGFTPEIEQVLIDLSRSGG